MEDDDEEEENMEAFDQNDAPIPAISPKYFKQAKNKTERDIEVRFSCYILTIYLLFFV